MNYTPQNTTHGLGLELISAEFGTVGFLYVVERSFNSNQLWIECAGRLHTYQGTLLGGKQRLLLPDAALSELTEALLNGAEPTIRTEGFATTLSPHQFKKKYQKFSHYKPDPNFTCP